MAGAIVVDDPGLQTATSGLQLQVRTWNHGDGSLRPLPAHVPSNGVSPVSYPTASIGRRPRASLLAALAIAGALAASPSLAQDAGARTGSILVEGD